MTSRNTPAPLRSDLRKDTTFDSIAGAVSQSAGGIAHETGELHRLLVASVQDYAIFALDPHGYILSWNDGARRFKGYEADEVIGKHFSIFYPQALQESHFPDYELEVAAKVGRFEDTGWRVRKDGTQFWANVVITALRDSTGTLVGYAKVTRDLTERRIADAALRESEQRFRLLVQTVKDYAIFMLDPQGRVATWNQGAERIKGYSAAEIIGQHMSVFYPPEALAAGKTERELEIATREGSYEEEGVRLRKGGERFWASVVITAIRDEDGQLLGFAKVTRDLTERRAAETRALEDARRIAREEAARAAAESRAAELGELADRLREQAEELEVQRTEAETANKAKSTFLAAMSHELRTPLNAIGGYAELLELGISGPVTDPQVEQLQRIRRSQQHLLRVINDILNFSRVEAAQLSYDYAKVSMAQVVESVGQMILPQAAKKGIRFEQPHCDASLRTWADQAKVEQILLNLLSNAVKFTDEGGTVTLTCARSATGVSAEVRDTGVGIAASELEAIFEPFVQIGRSLTSIHEGTGLGLAISRDLARAMGGDIVVSSVADEGSTFTLTLPAAKDDQP
jgi:PAS domain S-box-containing protein